MFISWHNLKLVYCFTHARMHTRTHAHTHTDKYQQEQNKTTTKHSQIHNNKQQQTRKGRRKKKWHLYFLTAVDFYGEKSAQVNTPKKWRRSSMKKKFFFNLRAIKPKGWMMATAAGLTFSSDGTANGSELLSMPLSLWLPGSDPW